MPGTEIPSLVLDHIVGSRRTDRRVLLGDTLTVGSHPGADIHLTAERYPMVQRLHATLTRQGKAYIVRAQEEADVFVNGEPVVAQLLRHGDAVRIGEGGPVMRFRSTPGRHDAPRTVAQVMRDCLDGARLQYDPGIARVAALLRDAPSQVLTETSPWVRRGLVVSVVVLFAAVGFLTWRTFTLERQLDRARAGYFEGLDKLAAQAGASGPLTVEELQALEDRIEERLDVLEARSEAGERIISGASRSVVLVLGSYGFAVADGRPLRLVVGPGGIPLRDAAGNPRLTVEGEGPILQSQFTGTAFVATDDGLLLTNRHVALPWEYNPAAQEAIDRGLVPVMHRMAGYLPGLQESFAVELVAASDDADLAVLRCTGVTGRAAALPLSERESRQGESVFLLGYPTGMRALLARSEPSFVDSLRREGPLDFWKTADRLSAGGHVAPLATRGIVGQVTRSSIVYDAETTQGGSGGPVLDLTGRVQAVNAAVVTDFGGSNIGVPAAKARMLLETIREQESP